MRFVTFVVIALMLGGCTQSPATSLDVRTDVNRRLMFLKHDNGLCFAVVYSTVYAGEVLSLTNIPCTRGDTVFVK